VRHSWGVGRSGKSRDQPATTAVTKKVKLQIH
jgi:hypothetical protein